uniref:HORMA domain-containing protein n=1 Tax=Periophthalmus magnuspinnatus TaxID=409849 RepID=A0A3B4AF84_9GOBI
MTCRQRTHKILCIFQDTQLLPNQVASEQQSLIVVKKLLAIAVSGITYLRGLFPEKAYGTKHVDDQKVMILREEKTCPGASQIVYWYAFMMSNLTTLFQKVTEFYQFRFQYTKKGSQMEFESKDKNKVSSMACGNTKKASMLLVRKLYTLMQNLGPLPDNVCLNMKLAYYEDVTPQDYQPPGFKETDGDSMGFEREPVKLNMGEVVTPYHTLKLDMATERQRLEQVPTTDKQPESNCQGNTSENMLQQQHPHHQINKLYTQNTQISQLISNTLTQAIISKSTGYCDPV